MSCYYETLVTPDNYTEMVLFSPGLYKDYDTNFEVYEHNKCYAAVYNNLVLQIKSSITDCNTRFYFQRPKMNSFHTSYYVFQT